MPSKLKILQINKFHYIKGGAERYYFDNAEILAKNGHNIAFFSMKHPQNRPSRWEKYFIDYIEYGDDNIGLAKKIRAVFNIFYNFQAKRNLEKLIKEFKPDVAHLHNIAHQLSPAIIYTLKKYNIPMVQTLHDYKLICPNYKLFNKGKICHQCRGGKYYNCFLGKCLKNSYLKSFLAMSEAHFYNKILKIYEKIDLFIAPSRFVKDICVGFGAPKEKIKTLPYFIRTDKFKPKYESGKYLLYLGRLTEEKGTDTLLEAMRSLGDEARLKIIGTGEAEEALKTKCRELGLEKRVEFLGRKTGEELREIIRNSLALIVPSKWPEVSGIVNMEAGALGKPVIASDIGGIKEVVREGETGLLFKPGSSRDLFEKINKYLRDFKLVQKHGRQASAWISQNFSPAQHYGEISKIYLSLCKKRKS